MASRIRNFATIVYEESAPADWVSKVADWHIPAFISPYHDHDTHEDWSEKKPHWHVMVMFDGVKSDSQVKEMFDQIGGVGLEKILSRSGYARYLIHLDDYEKNPHKPLYDKALVQEFGGADYLDACTNTQDELDELRAMLLFIRDSGIISYRQFVDYCMFHDTYWFNLIAKKFTYIIKEYLKSKGWELKACGGLLEDIEPNVIIDTDVEYQERGLDEK